MVILKCPHCGGHSEATVTELQEVYFSCDFCDTTQTHFHIPEENFGKLLLCIYSRKPLLKDYVLLTVRLEDGFVQYYVLSNTDMVWQGDSMIKGVDEYMATVKRIGL